MAVSREEPRRPYRLGRRQEGLAATRARIIGAARDSLAAGQQLTLNVVAEKASVSRPTLYHHFKSRRGLLDAVIADAQENSGVAVAIHAAQDPDPIKALVGWLRAAVGFWTKEAEVLLPAWLAAQADPDLSGAFEDQEMHRLQRARALAARLAERNLLRRPWTSEQAASFLWLLSGPHCLQQMRGTVPVPVDFVVHVATQSLLTSRGLSAAHRVYTRDANT
jgi:AcrR family transcriptional regulator